VSLTAVQSGRARFRVALYDSEGGRSAEQLLHVNVQPVNSAPTFTLIDTALAGQNLGAQARVRLPYQMI
jgi:hypothetical protein